MADTDTSTANVVRVESPPGGRSQARPVLQDLRARLVRADRDRRRDHDLADDGLHPVREPGDPRVRRDPRPAPLGLPFAQVLTVTALVAGVMTIAMGVVANYPFALAAGLGLNAFVAFTLVAANGLTFPQAMGVIVVEGVIITILVLTGLREAVLNAIPMDLKRAIGIGIGLFIALIGLVNAGRGHQHADPRRSRSPPTSRRWPILHVRRRARAQRRAGRAEGQGRPADRHPGHDGVRDHRQRGVKDLSIWSNGIAAIPDKIVDTPDFSLVGDVLRSTSSSVLGTRDRDRGGALGDAVGLLRHDGHRRSGSAAR